MLYRRVLLASSVHVCFPPEVKQMTTRVRLLVPHSHHPLQLCNFPLFVVTKILWQKQINRTRLSDNEILIHLFVYKVQLSLSWFCNVGYGYMHLLIYSNLWVFSEISQMYKLVQSHHNDKSSSVWLSSILQGVTNIMLVKIYIFGKIEIPNCPRKAKQSVTECNCDHTMTKSQLH